MQNCFGRFDTTSFQEIILSSGVFRRETASGFYPWGNVVGPRKRAAEGLCGWRHGNSFPMTQSAQSHRQMRSIPHCHKAVFYVFVFDSIHNSATLHNLSPGIFHWTENIPNGISSHLLWNNMHIISFFLLKYKVFYEIFLSLRIGKICIYNFII